MSRVILVACSATKLDHPAPAADLYQGDVFRLLRRIIEHPQMHGLYSRWGILSAKHGLVMPEQVLAPYDVTLSAMPPEERRAWDAMVAQQLADRWGAGAIYRVYAGRDYIGWERRIPHVEDVFGWWARDHREAGKRSRFGIGHIRSRLAGKLRSLDEAAERWAQVEAEQEDVAPVEAA